MRPFAGWPIKWKLILIILTTSLVGLLFAGAAFTILNQYDAKKKLTKEMLVLADVIANRSTAALVFDDPQLAKQNLAALKADPSIHTACIYTQSLVLFAHYHRPDHPFTLCPPGLPKPGTVFDKDSFSLSLPIVLDGNQLGMVYILTDLRSLDVHLKNFLIGTMVIIPLSVFVVFPLSFLLQRLISEPAAGLVHTATLVARDKDYSIRAEKRGSDELGLLADALNSMLTTIEEQDHTLRDDIARRQQNEAELKRLQSLLINIVDSMPSILVGVDGDRRVTQWNRQAEKVTGKKMHQVLGTSLAEVFPQLIGELENVNRAIREKRTQVDMKVVGLLGNNNHYSDVAIFPLITNGVEGAVIRIDDVTERVRIEEMMIQSEKMLSVGGLAAGMAHEINNPLAVILQSGQVIHSRVSMGLAKNRQAAEACGTTMESIHKYLEDRGVLSKIDLILESGFRASQTVENMLSFSRKSESRIIPYDLGKLLDKTIELAANEYDLKKKFDFREIEIIRDYDPGMPAVSCEGSKIQQVFLNLLRNGAQAMADSKTKDIPSQFMLRTRQEGHWAQVEVADNGPGMDENTRKRIFEPFFTTKEVGVGTGLGLSVSYFIISEHHHGTMAVKSAPGHGTRFIIRLPMERED